MNVHYKGVAETEGSKCKPLKGKGVVHTGESKSTTVKRQTKASERKSLPAKIVHEEKPLLDQVSPKNKNKLDFKVPTCRSRNPRKSEPTVNANVENEKKTVRSISAIDKRNSKGETKLQIACIKVMSNVIKLFILIKFL